MTEIHQAFATGLQITPAEVMLGVGTDHPECLCGIILGDVNPEDMTATLREILPNGSLTRACIQVIHPEYTDRFKGMDWDTAWDESWDFLVATVRYE